MADSQVLKMLGERWPLLAILSLVIAGTSLVTRLQYYVQLRRIQILGADRMDEKTRQNEWMNASKKLYMEAYKSFMGGICRVTSPRDSDFVVVSHVYLDELRRLPDDHVSFRESVLETLQAKHTHFTTEDELITDVVRNTLTPGLARLSPVIQQQTEETMAKELPEAVDWTPVNLNQKLLRIVAQVSGRVFIGPELCVDEKYIKAAIQYTVDVMSGVRAVQTLPRWQRNLRARFLPEIKSANRWGDEAVEFLTPVIEAREAAAARLGDKYEKPDDALQWVMDGAAKRNRAKVDTDLVARAQLGLSFAAIHTTTQLTSNALYNIATMPEVQDELRDEVVQVLKEFNGNFSTLALQKMKKVDSFLRETMRFEPAGYISFGRKVLKPITLSSGQVIPAGVHIEVPAIGMNFDPEVHPDPEKFDHLRFYHARQKSSAAGAGMNQLVSVNNRHLPFGYGRHACPGRFFATNEIKMIFANILVRYRIKNPEGVEGRVPNIPFGATSIPDPTKEFMIQRR